MINEVLLVENLLNGIGIDENCMYQHCYLIAKYYLQQGYEPFAVRKKIFAWANAYKIYLDAEKLNLNQVIYKAGEDKRRLREDIIIRVSGKDLKEITDRFDNPKTRKVALAILCYAKAAADRDNCFDLSVVSFCSWLNMDYSFMLKTYLRELQSFGYIRKMKTSERKTFSWNGNVKSKSANFKLLVNFNNSGEHILVNNDIDALFEECFP